MMERDEIEQVITEMRERSREFAGQVGGCQCETSWHSAEIDGWAERLSSALLRRSRAVLSPGGAAEKDTPVGFERFAAEMRLAYAEGRELFRREALALVGDDERLRAVAWSILGAIGEISVDEGIAALKREKDKGAAEGRSRAVPEESK